MFTILLQADNTTQYTNTTGVKIIKKSTSNTVQILSPAKDDEGNDLTDAVLQFEYIYPVSKEYGIKYLTANSTEYKTGYELQYLLPMGAEMTKEAGDIKFTITFMKLVEGDDGVSVNEYVNKHLEGTITIEEGTVWQTYIPDDLLDAVDQKILKLQAQQNALIALAAQLAEKQPADITLDTENEKITLINSDDETIGNGVDVHALTPYIGEDIAGKDEDGTIDGVTKLDDLI